MSLTFFYGVVGRKNVCFVGILFSHEVYSTVVDRYPDVWRPVSLGGGGRGGGVAEPGGEGRGSWDPPPPELLPPGPLARPATRGRACAGQPPFHLHQLMRALPRWEKGGWSTYIEYSSSSELGLPHPLSRKRVCPLPGTKRGGGTLACGRGGGAVPIPTTGEKV